MSISKSQNLKRPNILYLNSHDTGRYIQPHGYAVPTPNLQRLAEQSIFFRQAFCVNPTCSPSRAALLTGQYPHQAGMFGLAHRGWSLNDYTRHWAHQLKAEGYRTHLIGMQHVFKVNDQESLRTIGYDSYEREGDQVAHAQKQIDDHLANHADTPLYLEIGFTETHRDFPPAGPADDPRYIQPPAPLPDTPATRQDMADYHAIARKLDERYGLLLGLLRDRGLYDNTLIICTTDHGIAFPLMKCNLTDHGTGVLLMIKPPKRDHKLDLDLEPGKCVDAMVSHIDLYPTLCDMLDITPPNWLEGKSLLPLMQCESKDEVDEIHNAIFSSVNHHAATEPMRSVRTKRYKYIRRYKPLSYQIMPNCDNSLSKTELYEHGWRDRPQVEEELYDLIYDPHEACNLASDPQLAAIKNDLIAQLEAWQARTDDPLLTGDLPENAQAIFTPTDEYSPAPKK